LSSAATTRNSSASTRRVRRLKTGCWRSRRSHCSASCFCVSLRRAGVTTEEIRGKRVIPIKTGHRRLTLLLHADFRAPRLVALITVSLPFALVSGVAATLLTGGVLCLGSLVGFVTVLGIAARNGIMLVSHYRRLEAEEGQPFGNDLVLRGSDERLAPILMTALATGLALLPIVVGGNKPGPEIEHPLAVVI